MLKRMIVAMRMKRSRERYRAHKCPACTAALDWIPEAPGATCGKACDQCRIIWTNEAARSKGRVTVHPYARLA